MFDLTPNCRAQIFQLTIANETLVEPPPDPRRFEELYVARETTTVPFGCTAPGGATTAAGCMLYESFAVYDWKWYSQLAVGVAGRCGGCVGRPARWLHAVRTV
eukprot:365975-Chlamydomonas_euryale.AAC.5